MGNCVKRQGDRHGQCTGGSSTPEARGNMKIFTFAQLKKATGNFNPDNVVSEGRFGPVFKGWFNENTYAPERPGVGVPLSVKKFSEEWLLLGYYGEKGQFFIVYEYMHRGNLENHLFNDGGAPHLSWEMRLHIAIGAAQGLSFLHSSEKSAIYLSFKASSILLDAAYNAKLSDFGPATPTKEEDRSFLTGYEAPEYINGGHLSVGSDVYGFGLMLLEMLTGRRVVGREQNLVEWAKYSLTGEKRLKKAIDPNLQGKYPVKAALLAGELILNCLVSCPRNRPPMQQVLDTLQTINQQSKHGGAGGSQSTNN
ncbi:hypothetical protein V6N13_066842 [Hibiscus sabdariffa]